MYLPTLFPLLLASDGERYSLETGRVQLASRRGMM